MMQTNPKSEYSYINEGRIRSLLLLKMSQHTRQGENDNTVSIRRPEPDTTSQWKEKKENSWRQKKRAD